MPWSLLLFFSRIWKEIAWLVGISLLEVFHVVCWCILLTTHPACQSAQKSVPKEGYPWLPLLTFLQAEWLEDLLGNIEKNIGTRNVTTRERSRESRYVWLLRIYIYIYIYIYILISFLLGSVSHYHANYRYTRKLQEWVPMNVIGIETKKYIA